MMQNQADTLILDSKVLLNIALKPSIRFSNPESAKVCRHQDQWIAILS